MKRCMVCLLVLFIIAQILFDWYTYNWLTTLRSLAMDMFHVVKEIYYKVFWGVMIVVLLIITASSGISKMLCDQIRNIKEIENKEKPA